MKSVLSVSLFRAPLPAWAQDRPAVTLSQSGWSKYIIRIGKVALESPVLQTDIYARFPNEVWIALSAQEPIGSNRRLAAGMLAVDFKTPWDFLAKTNAEARSAEATNPFGSENLQNSCWWTYGESNPDFIHAMDA